MVQSAQQMCECEAEGEDAKWCDACNSLKRQPPRQRDMEEAMHEEQRCDRCENPNATNDRYRKKFKYEKKQATANCNACGRRICERHGGKLCGDCTTYALIRANRVESRWTKKEQEAQPIPKEARRQRVRAACEASGAENIPQVSWKKGTLSQKATPGYRTMEPCGTQCEAEHKEQQKSRKSAGRTRREDQRRRPSKVTSQTKC